MEAFLATVSKTAILHSRIYQNAPSVTREPLEWFCFIIIVQSSDSPRKFGTSWLTDQVAMKDKVINLNNPQTFSNLSSEEELE